ncbi:right-handed parallel beta-helix repeat-containing protein [bacterium]|nr:right-handed parallel beta-helix repeat-containing protein [bacterium]
MGKMVLRIFLISVIISVMQLVRADNCHGTPKDHLQSTGNQTIVTGKVYYVAKDGSDSWDGSEEHPWQNIQKAADTMVAGDTVYIKEGVYTENVLAQQSGSPEKFITYKVYPGHKPAIDAGGNGTAFSIIGKSYIRMDSLEIRNAGNWGILVEDSTNIEIRNVKVSYSNLENIQIRGESNQIVIEDCEVSYSQHYSGIDVYEHNGRPHHVTVRNCTAHHNQQFAGIASEQTDNLIIDSNICYDNELGIDIGSGDNNIIRNNTVYDCETGIALSSNEDSEVYDNIIYDIENEAIYSYCFSANGEAHSRNKWYRNIVYNSGFGIYESKWDWQGNEGASSDHEFYINLFYDIGTHGAYRVPFYFQGSTGIKFRNNTIYMNANYDAVQFLEGAINSRIENNIISISGNKSPILLDSSSSTGAVIDYNCYHNRAGTVTGLGEHSIAEDPKFVDVAGHDFHLQKTSPCVDAGDPATGADFDLDGKQSPQDGDEDGKSIVDMGAYEYPGPRPPIEGVEVRNRPNPFRAGKEETLIEYNLKQPSNVTITIYDLLGQQVWHKSYRAGENGGREENSVPWDGRNLSGEVVGNGGYVCRIWVEKEKRHMLRKIAVAK